MNLIYVNSSDLEAIAIHGNNLVIKFKSGGMYEYYNAACEFNNILSASSKGRYFHKYIKPYYKTSKIY